MMNKEMLTKICAVIACLTVVGALVARLPMSFAQETRVFISPDFIETLPGNNFTVTVNVSNVVNLFTWEATIKYNASVINITAVWYSENHVFANEQFVPVDPNFGVSRKDNLNYVSFGNSLFFDGIDVANGILFKMNFTVVGYGETTLRIVTKDDAIQYGVNPWDILYTYLLLPVDPDEIEIPFIPRGSTVVSSEVDINVGPIAIFKVTNVTVSDPSFYVIRGYAPSGKNVAFAQTYKGYATEFNASASYDPDGFITNYLWNFGDGNITETPDPFITHVFSVPRGYNVTLTVTDNGDPDPPLNSSVKFSIVVGLVLVLYDWMPFTYTVAGLLVAGIVVYSARGAVRRIRRRRALVTQKPL